MRKSIIFILSIALSTHAWANFKQNGTDPNSTANLLDWVPSQDPAHLCGGYFKEPTTLIQEVTAGQSGAVSTQIHSNGPVDLNQKGRTVLSGGVTVTQPGRILKADTLYIYRDSETHKISSLEFVGHVRYQQPGRIFVAPQALLDLQTNTLTMPKGVYHLYHRGLQQYSVDSWGEGENIERDGAGVITIHNGTYSNASPINPAWKLHAKKIVLNRNTGWGKAYNAWLTFKHVPLFYAPFFSFPITHERQTGFLVPMAGITSNNGLDIKVPFYWNIAPNYDTTITPRWMEKRGVLWADEFRFLTKDHQGTFNGGYLPEDRQFNTFRQTVLNTYPDDNEFHPFLEDIRKESNNRGHIFGKQESHWTSALSSQFIVNYVSDDYYFQDLGSPFTNDVTSNQLLNEFNVKYTGEHWQAVLLARAYETLHPITQANNPAEDQYQRLPEFDINGDYPDLMGGLDLGVGAQAVNFDYHSDIFPNKATGQRVHVRPGISLPLTWAAFHVTPQLQWDTTGYSLENLQPGMSSTMDRNLPILNVDSGLYFSRLMHWGQHLFTQTLEPHVFYLLVPYTNQSNLPNFDTEQLPLTYDQLFGVNRFTGFDRLQNANQLSLGLRSRLLSSETGEQKLSADIGIADYFTPPKVCIQAGCAAQNIHFSPVVGELTYNPTPLWNIIATGAYDGEKKRVDNAGFSFKYEYQHTHIFDTGFQFIQTNDDEEGSSKYETVHAGFAWPLGYRWNGLAYAEYNLNDRHPQNLYAGLEYETCGWALRFITSRSFLGINENNHNQYQTIYSLEFALTGLGSIGNHSASGLLSQTLPGYINPRY